MSNAALTRHHYPELGEAVGPYVHATSFQNVLYTSGLTAFGSSTQDKDISQQLVTVFDQIETITRHHNVDLDAIIKVTIFITDLTTLHQARDALMKIYGGKFPASSLVKVDALFHPDLLVEVEAVIALAE
ncbi:RidA family protein [Vibrio amylolyticus]|uniref:RidA family protein n=1 Tax=Vibrio TaxID=662 RepID=UPI000C817A7F|nr:RidA family protein [Vibrio sp. 10N.261.55.A7]PMJ92783.1 enamine deaminase RidA [Vibrio sp. 10N.261.55.A7]